MARTPRSDYLVLDIETVPDVTRWQKPEDRPEIFPPNWAHQIVAIGALWLDRDYRLGRLGVVAGRNEGALLVELSRLVGARRPTLVTYNGRSFDLPVIAIRALCHGVPIPWYYRDPAVRARHSEAGHLDLCDTLADHGATRVGGLDAIARLIGLPGKLGVDGSQVEGLYARGALADIEAYCLTDVAQTALLLLRFRLLQGRLAPAVYRARTDALLAGLAADPRTEPVVRGADRAQLLLS